MEEIYTCRCGEQKWFIKHGEIECCECGTLYQHTEPESPDEFNRRNETE